jgi:hydroxymethylglutaryl-CoA lyase
MTRAADIRIVEVGPRDGLQNEKLVLSVKQRIALIEALAGAGLRMIEAGSFVSPARVLQMAGTADVLAGLASHSDLRLPVLVPNAKGLEAAKSAGAREIAVFAAASETFSRRNINRGIDESLVEYRSVVADALSSGMTVRGYVSCVLGCPYEGKVAAKTVIRVASSLAAMGCSEISLGDTIGVGTPDKARSLVGAVSSEIGIEKVALHFHDTYGQALTNVYAALEQGVATFDCSVAGLGGCPYAKGATGNVASEDVVYLMQGLEIETGVDMTKLRRAGQYISDFLQRQPASRVARALNAKSPLPA